MIAEGDGYSAELEKNVHKTIKKVGEDYERMKFNTGIAALRSLVNDFYRIGRVTRGEFRTLITLLNPVAPHMTEELWEKYGTGGLLSISPWPQYDADKTVDDEIELAIQINGKVRDKILVSTELDRAQIEQAALEAEAVRKLTDGKTVVKVIVVPGKLVNIVVK